MLISNGTGKRMLLGDGYRVSGVGYREIESRKLVRDTQAFSAPRHPLPDTRLCPAF